MVFGLVSLILVCYDLLLSNLGLECELVFGFCLFCVLSLVVVLGFLVDCVLIGFAVWLIVTYFVLGCYLVLVVGLFVDWFLFVRLVWFVYFW